MYQTRATGLSHFAFAALSFAMALAVAGCKAESNAFSTSNASVGSGGGTVDANTGFRFRLKSKTGVDSFVHKFGDVNAACEIAPSEMSTPTWIRCMANMMEYDLWFYGYEYEVSLAGEHCAFLEDIPYRYYKGAAGRGPSLVEITMDKGVMTQCMIDGVAGTGGTTCRSSEAVFSREGGLLSCVYDYSKGQPDQPNCCAGRATVVLTTITASASPQGPDTVATTTLQPDYGGKIENCLESPNDYIDGWPKDRSSNMAATVVVGLAGASYSRSVKIPAPLALQTSRSVSRSVFLNSGFHGWNEYAADPDAWALAVKIPKALDPGRDLGGDGSHSGPGATLLPSFSDGSMVFRCLNPAGEIKHQISVYMNEWNTIEDYTAFKETGDLSATPNRTGLASVNCESINGLGLASCNSFWGWDDIIADTTYPLGTGLSGHGDPEEYIYPYEGSRGTPP